MPPLLVNESERREDVWAFRHRYFRGYRHTYTGWTLCMKIWPAVTAECLDWDMCRDVRGGRRAPDLLAACHARWGRFRRLCRSPSLSSPTSLHREHRAESWGRCRWAPKETLNVAAVWKEPRRSGQTRASNSVRTSRKRPNGERRLVVYKNTRTCQRSRPELLESSQLPH